MFNPINKVTIIGGSGFIGTRLVTRLMEKKDQHVRVIDKSSSRAFPDLVTLSDVRSIEELRRSMPEGSIIVNLAAEHRDDIHPLQLYDDVNVGGAANICTVAKEKAVNTIIFTSTVAVYGFAPIGTDETGKIAPFNEYGRTKYAAEKIYRAWQAEKPAERTLVIVRPTVVFGEKNRGNVFNLLRQIASGKFIMVGAGNNRKSMAYVENVAAFLQYSISSFPPGLHIYNYIDKPDTTMNALVGTVNRLLGKSERIYFRLPFILGYLIGKCFDVIASVSGKRFAISAIRVKKFCSNSVYETSISDTSFVPPVSLESALERTVRYEFIEKHENADVFYSE